MIPPRLLFLVNQKNKPHLNHLPDNFIRPRTLLKLSNARRRQKQGAKTIKIPASPILKIHQGPNKLVIHQGPNKLVLPRLIHILTPQPQQNYLLPLGLKNPIIATRHILWQMIQEITPIGNCQGREIFLKGSMIESINLFIRRFCRHPHLIQPT